MKVKVIKRAELEQIADEAAHVPEEPKRRRLKQVVEKWVTDIRRRVDAEERVAFDDLFQPDGESST